MNGKSINKTRQAARVAIAAYNLELPEAMSDAGIAKAIAYLDLAMKLAPDDAATNKLYGNFLFTQKEFVKSTKYLEDAVSLGDKESLFTLAKAFIITDKKNAVSKAEEYCKANPTDAKAKIITKLMDTDPQSFATKILGWNGTLSYLENK